MVRRAEGNGFYTWDTERKEIPAGQWDVTRGTIRRAEHFVRVGGYFELEAKGTAPMAATPSRIRPFMFSAADTPRGNASNHNRIQLVPERRPTNPRHRAIMIQSPWESARRRWSRLSAKGSGPIERSS
jgi:hypothetical protein